MLLLVTNTNTRQIWFLSNEKPNTCNRSSFRGNKCSPTNFPLTAVPRSKPSPSLGPRGSPPPSPALGQAPGQSRTALVTWAARPPSCQAEEGRPCLAAVWAATARDPSALGRTPRLQLHEPPARAPAFSLRNPVRPLPCERLGHRGPSSNSWARQRESALKTAHLHQQPQE